VAGALPQTQHGELTALPDPLARKGEGERRGRRGKGGKRKEGKEGEGSEVESS